MVYKLTYFDFNGLAEPIRFLLSYGKIDFEDIRIKFEDWPKLKDSMPFGQMPLLEFDGKKLHQSTSISRFLAKKVGLDGKTDFENFEIDSVVDTVTDLRIKVIDATFVETDETLKEKKFKTLTQESIPFYYKKLDEVAKENNGHLALKRLTWADLFFTSTNEVMCYMTKQDLTAKYPNLKKVTENVYSLEGIKKWIAKRPKQE